MPLQSVARRRPIPTLLSAAFVLALLVTLSSFAGLVPGVPKTLPTFVDLLLGTAGLFALAALARAVSFAVQQSGSLPGASRPREPPPNDVRRECDGDETAPCRRRRLRVSRRRHRLRTSPEARTEVALPLGRSTSVQVNVSATSERGLRGASSTESPTSTNHGEPGWCVRVVDAPGRFALDADRSDPCIPPYDGSGGVRISTELNS
jgi:hypothetical protein